MREHTVSKPMTFTYTHPDYPGFILGNPDNLRNGPEGEICDYQILSTPADMEWMKDEIHCWLTLLTAKVEQD